jgi:hypothetical protein
LEVSVVNPANIQPSQKTIYFRRSGENPYHFQIQDGSGHFKVSLNDTTLAQKKLVGRDLTIIPEREGVLNITI